MAVSAAIVTAAAAVGTAAISADNAKKQRKQAEEQAASEREALAALQAKPVPVVPQADDAAVKAARRRSISAQMARRGRASTILTDQTQDTLGA